MPLKVQNMDNNKQIGPWTLEQCKYVCGTPHNFSQLWKRQGTEEPGSEEGFNKWGRFIRFPRINVVNFIGLYNYILYTLYSKTEEIYLIIKIIIFKKGEFYAIKWGRLRYLKFGSKEGQTGFWTLYGGEFGYMLNITDNYAHLSILFLLMGRQSFPSCS